MRLMNGPIGTPDGHAEAGRFTALLMTLIVAFLSGCVEDSVCASLPRRIEVTVTADGLAPADPATCRGKDVSLVVTAEVDGVIHLHGYDAEVPATEIAAGEVTELEFTASRSGQFPIELHTDEDAAGASIGIFTVHEP
jgi:hypothetical protein